MVLTPESVETEILASTSTNLGLDLSPSPLTPLPQRKRKGPTIIAVETIREAIPTTSLPIPDNTNETVLEYDTKGGMQVSWEEIEKDERPDKHKVEEIEIINIEEEKDEEIGAKKGKIREEDPNDSPTP